MKKENKFYSTFLAIICIGLMTSLLGACMIFTKRSPTNLLPTPIVDSTANYAFIETIGPVDELNTGITIERLQVAQIDNLPTPSPNYISLLVLNHTEESVVFNDIGFDIQVFQYSQDLLTWEKVALRSWPEKSQKVLPPKLEKFDFNIWNSWEILDGDIMNLSSSNLRIYISGKGTTTQKIYGAFLDLTLQY